MIDDVWVAHYAAACFSGDSLLWYSDLDEAIRNSWSELRRALLRQYLQNRQHNPPSAVPPAPGNSYLPQPPAAGPARRARPLSQSPSDIRRGRIEVFLPQHARTVGFLAFNERASTFSTVQDLAQAQVISFPNVPLNSRFHIRMAGFFLLNIQGARLIPFSLPGGTPSSNPVPVPWVGVEKCI